MREWIDEWIDEWIEYKNRKKVSESSEWIEYRERKKMNTETKWIEIMVLDRALDEWKESKQESVRAHNTLLEILSLLLRYLLF